MKQPPTQTTPKGEVIPVPKRRDFIRDLKKALGTPKADTVRERKPPQDVSE